RETRPLHRRVLPRPSRNTLSFSPAVPTPRVLRLYWPPSAVRSKPHTARRRNLPRRRTKLSHSRQKGGFGCLFVLRAAPSRLPRAMYLLVMLLRLPTRYSKASEFSL